MLHKLNISLHVIRKNVFDPLGETLEVHHDYDFFKNVGTRHNPGGEGVQK